jgi:hypothetical protein
MGSTVVAAVQLYFVHLLLCMILQGEHKMCHQYVHDVICEMLCELFMGICLFVNHLLDLPMTMNMLQQIILLSHVRAPHIGQS